MHPILYKTTRPGKQFKAKKRGLTGPARRQYLGSSFQAQPALALAFDVFGTVVDWRSSVAAAGASLGEQLGVQADWNLFADQWRAGYAPAMDRVRKGDLPWMHIDNLHRMILDGLIEPFGLQAATQAQLEHLNKVWHRLTPWADSVNGLTQLKTKFTITTLSNGNFSLLTAMAKNAGLPWDCIVSAELFKHYKPDPETYLGCAGLLNIKPEQLMLVACHPSDLRAARAQGLQTAYVKRPLEFGAHVPLPSVTEGEFDCVAEDFLDLAKQLGCVG